MEELEQRLTEIEQRLTALEAQAHSGHTIGLEAMDEIAVHAVKRLNESIRAIFKPKPASDLPVADATPVNAEEGK